jgi:hypothetical protein
MQRGAELPGQEEAPDLDPVGVEPGGQQGEVLGGAAHDICNLQYL